MYKTQYVIFKTYLKARFLFEDSLRRPDCRHNPRFVIIAWSWALPWGALPAQMSPPCPLMLHLTLITPCYNPHYLIGTRQKAILAAPDLLWGQIGVSHQDSRYYFASFSILILRYNSISPSLPYHCKTILVWFPTFTWVFTAIFTGHPAHLAPESQVQGRKLQFNPSLSSLAYLRQCRGSFS